MAELDESERWADVSKLLTRTGPMANEGNYGTIFEPAIPFEPDPAVLQFMRTAARVLVVGAGGLGCELLKDLALSGFGLIDVIDMDTIDVSNLNRQFLFRKTDVGRPKATVAAEFVMRRVQGVSVTAHYCAIQDKEPAWYRQFQVIVMGLDSIEARRWLNGMACSLVSYETTADGKRTPELTSVIPLVDGGTEGFSGHVRVIYPGVSACFECTLDLFPPQQAVPLCTIAETPRNAAHCILYAHLIEAPKHFPDEKPDKDDPVYQQWVLDRALDRASHFNIPGVTLMHTQGVIKNIIPAIASTNAIVAGACANEVLKIVSNCAPYLNNNLMYIGRSGVYAPTFTYEKNPNCIVCGSGVVLSTLPTRTLAELLSILSEDARLRLKKPSLRVESGAIDGEIIYMQGIMEENYRHNLPRPISQLFSTGATLIVTDPAVPSDAIRVVVEFESVDESMR